MSVDTISILVESLDPLDAALLPAGSTHLDVEFEYEPAEAAGVLTPPRGEDWGVLNVAVYPSAKLLNKQLDLPEWNGIKRSCERAVDDYICAAKGEPNLRVEDE